METARLADAEARPVTTRFTTGEHRDRLGNCYTHSDPLQLTLNRNFSALCKLIKLVVLFTVIGGWYTAFGEPTREPHEAGPVLKWQHESGPVSVGGLAVSGEGVSYVSGQLPNQNDGILFALDRSGHRKWTVEERDQFGGFHLAVDSFGHLYACSYGDSYKLLKLDTEGKVLWRKEGGNPVGSLLALHSDQSLIAAGWSIFGNVPFSLMQYGNDGAPLRRFDFPGYSLRGLALSRHVTYASTGENLWALNETWATGWKGETGSLSLQGDGSVIVSGTTAVTVYTQNGTRAWSLKRLTPLPPGHHGLEVVTDHQGFLYLADGSEIVRIGPGGLVDWRHNAATPISTPATVGDDGVVYVAAGDEMMMLDLDGKVVRPALRPLAGTISLTTLTSDGQLIFATSSGRIVSMEVPSKPSAGSWPMYGHDAQQSRRLALGTPAGIVSNVRASQRPGTSLVDLFYDLRGAGTNYSVVLTVSSNSGASFTVPATRFNGSGVTTPTTPGVNRHIVWDAGADFPGNFSAKIRIKVAAGSAFDTSPVFTVDTRTAGETFSVQALASLFGETSSAGVKIEVRQNGALIANAETDLFGHARVNGLRAGYYEVQANKQGYLPKTLPHLRVPEDTQEPLNFLFTSPPGAPPLFPSDTLPWSTLVAGLDMSYGVALRTWKDGSFKGLQALDTNKMTIVMTHGCASSPEAWPKAMAETLVAHVPGINERANIVAWDWRDAAFSDSTLWGGCNFCDLLRSGVCVLPRQNTPVQGRMLGAALRDALGSDYQKPVHFVGHSLGTLVNAVAADYVHGDDHSQSELPGWSPSRTHMTLLDHAGLLPGFRFNLLPVGWALPLPKRAAYVDNYMTLVGVVLDEPGHNIVNAFLQGSKNLLDPVKLHSYPADWYINSIKNPTASSLGFRHSFESPEDSAAFPVPAPYPRGAIFAQDEQSVHELDLVNLEVPEGLPRRVAIELVTKLPLGGGALIYSLRATRAGVKAGTVVIDAVVTTGGKGARKIGDVTVAVVESTLDHYGGTLNPLADPVYGVGQTTPTVIGIPGFKEEVSPVSSWSLEFHLKTAPAGPFPLGEPSRQLSAMASGETNKPAYAWLPVRVPEDAIALVFDFILSGDIAQDRIVAGVNTSNIFNLPGESLPTNAPMNTGPLPISAWAGEEIELFIGLAGGTSTNAVLKVNAIRFLSLPLPVLQVERSGEEAVLSWVEASPGFVLEQSASLHPGNWTRVENVAGYPGQRWFTNTFSSPELFYRLRQGPQ